MVEILAPAGNLNNLIIAVNSGADAVYLGLSNFSARKSSQNFNFEELKYAINYAKCYGVKVYIAVNTLIKDIEINEFIESVGVAYSYGADAFILQDIFLGKLLKEYYPEICLHLSTQAGVCNVYGAKMAVEYGFSRAILARETKLEDIKAISSIIETEVFIQGALCSSFSGHCYFSSFIGGLSGNRGHCKQPCRKRYTLEGNDKFNGYLLSLSDLCIGNDIKTLIDLGVSSFKIEGRMRSAEYVASAIKYYKGILNDTVTTDDFINLKKTYNRGDYTKGLAFSQTPNFISRKIQNHKGYLVGKVKNIYKDVIKLDRVTTFTDGDSFKILRNGYEVGNAIYKNGAIKFKGNVKLNDEVYITKDIALINQTENVKREKIKVTIDVYCKVGEKLTLTANGVTVSSSDVLSQAKTSPLTKTDVVTNLNRTDIYPYNPIVNFVCFDENVFIPKSILNNLRVELYSALFNINTVKISDNIKKYTNNSILDNSSEKSKTLISNTLVSVVDNLIYLPNDYNKIDFDKLSEVQKTTKVYLYLPSFLTGEDLIIIDKIVNNFNGVYVDGYYGLKYAQDKNLNVFIGVGFNLFNSYGYNQLKKLGVKDISISKELSEKDISTNFSNVNVLSYGENVVMNLAYCPFDKNCENCLYKSCSYIKDESGRKFELFRYKISECRFMLFNCAQILTKTQFNNEIFAIFNKSEKDIDYVINKLEFNDRKQHLKNHTYGNYIKGVL